MERTDAEARNDVMMGTIYLSHFPAFTLFDSGASCSFVSTNVVRKHVIRSLVPDRVSIILPSGGAIESF